MAITIASYDAEAAVGFANSAMQQTVAQMHRDGLLPDHVVAQAWLDTHAFVIAEKSWVERLAPKLTAWFGLRDSTVRIVLVKVCLADVPAPEESKP